MALVLIVDDDPAIRRLVTSLLTDLGLRVSAAQDGADALRLLAEEAPDLIVTDLRMPVMDGVDLLRAVRASEYSAMPVMVMSAGRVPAEVHALGVSGVVPKPFHIDDLERIVESVLQRSEAEQD